MLMVIEEEEASRGDLRRGRISRIGRNSRRTDAIVGATAVAGFLSETFAGLGLKVGM